MRRTFRNWIWKGWNTMYYTISNAYLDVTIASLGAELQSIKTKDGTEYLWQGDSSTWPDRATNIFPYVARLTKETYQYAGKEYQMKIHGFLSASQLEARQEGRDCITFCLRDNADTRKCYPFAFCYAVQYRLVERRLEITFQVENMDQTAMYFGIGGHPGFQVPLGGDGKFEDYRLEFAEPAQPYRIGMSDTCFVTGKDEAFSLQDGKILELRHNLFDNDAIILRDMCRKVTLRSEKSTRFVTVEYPEMAYLGIWHWPRAAVGYVCIEPWSSLPSRQDVIEDLTLQKDLIQLAPGGVYRNQWSITIG